MTIKDKIIDKLNKGWIISQEDCQRFTGHSSADRRMRELAEDTNKEGIKPFFYFMAKGKNGTFYKVYSKLRKNIPVVEIEGKYYLQARVRYLDVKTGVSKLSVHTSRGFASAKEAKRAIKGTNL